MSRNVERAGRAPGGRRAHRKGRVRVDAGAVAPDAAERSLEALAVAPEADTVLEGIRRLAAQRDEAVELARRAGELAASWKKDYDRAQAENDRLLELLEKFTDGLVDARNEQVRAMARAEIERRKRYRAEGARDEARANAEAAHEGAVRQRLIAEDVCLFGERVVALKLGTKGVGGKQEGVAIDEAWLEVPGLPTNASHERKRRTFKEWETLREQLGRSPTPEEWSRSRPRWGRPKKA